MTRGHSNVRANEILQVDVKSMATKDNLGKISDILLDKKSGNTLYAVLACGGFLGLGEKLFAIPWSDLHYNKEDGCFLVDIKKEKLESKPGFDKNHWPSMPSETDTLH